MKKYFKFTLEGEQVFVYIIIFILIILAPAVFMLSLGYSSAPQMYGTISFIPFIIYWIVAIPVMLYLFLMIVKLTISHIYFEEENADFSFVLSEYLGLVLRGFVLTVLSLGIYAPWFSAELTQYYAKNTSYKSKHFEFLGKGFELFKFIIVAGILPAIVLGIFFTDHLFNNPSENFFENWLLNLLTTLVFVPLTFLIYRWFIDFRFNGYKVDNEEPLSEGVQVIGLQLLINVATLGIYFPIAYLKIYRYLISTTTIKNDEGKQYQLDYDITEVEDFIFIWGQTLLLVVTLGIYAPWAFCKIYKRVIDKTSLSEIM